jgi:hypothetical protein
MQTVLIATTVWLQQSGRDRSQHLLGFRGPVIIAVF